MKATGNIYFIGLYYRQQVRSYTKTFVLDFEIKNKVSQGCNYVKCKEERKNMQPF